MKQRNLIRKEYLIKFDFCHRNRLVNKNYFKNILMANIIIYLNKDLLTKFLKFFYFVLNEKLNFFIKFLMTK